MGASITPENLTVRYATPPNSEPNLTTIDRLVLIRARRNRVAARMLTPDPVHYVTKHLQQGIESDHFRVKKNMPKIGGFQSFNTARRTIAGFEAMLWLRKGFGFSGGWTVNDQNDLLARLFGLQKVNKA